LEIQAGRNKTQAGDNKIQIRRIKTQGKNNKIQIYFIVFSMGYAFFATPSS
jgi:hypothetical protein